MHLIGLRSVDLVNKLPLTQFLDNARLYDVPNKFRAILFFREIINLYFLYSSIYCVKCIPKLILC